MSYPTRKVGAEFEQTATWTFSTCVVLDATPEEVFAIFENRHLWTIWHPPIKSVEWTTPKPFGVGTTRTVMLGDMEIREFFYAWEQGRRMAFRFEGTNKRTWLNFNAGIEDYLLEPCEDGTKTKYTRKVCLEPSCVVWTAGCMVRRNLQAMFDESAANLQKCIKEKAFEGK